MSGFMYTTVVAEGCHGHVVLVEAPLNFLVRGKFGVVFQRA